MEKEMDREIDTEARVRVLEAVIPRIEKNTNDTLEYLKKNMVTKSDLPPLLDADNDNKKKIKNIQYQIYALAGFFFLNSLLGTAKTISVFSPLISKIIAP